jgi:A/G-specific adenine glycosylase
LQRMGIQAISKGWWMNTEHTFSHIHWQMRVYRFEMERINSMPEGYRWATMDEIDQAALPNVFLRILKQYRDQTNVQ